MSAPDNTRAIIKKFEPILKDLSYFELTILNKMVVNRIRLFQKAQALASMSQFNLGDRVSWQCMDGTIKTGIIFRLNQKTVSVKTADDGHWNVSPALLRRD